MKVVVYSKSRCVQCDATKRLLDGVGQEYEVIALEGHPTALQWLKERGYMSAPVVEVWSDAGLEDSWAGFQPEKLRGIFS